MIGRLRCSQTTRLSMKKSLLLLCTLLITACQYDPHANLLTITKPNRDDIVGTYVTDRLDMPPGLTRTVDITVELHADGTFTATNVPPWKLDDPKDDFFSTLLSGTGRWELATMGQLDPGAHPLWGVYLRDGANRMAPAHLTGTEAPYGLIFELGDPDEGYAILLKRKLTPAAAE